MTTEEGQAIQARLQYQRGSLRPEVLDRVPESELRAELARTTLCATRRGALYESVMRRTRPRVAAIEARQ